MLRTALLSIVLILAGCSDNTPTSPTLNSIDGVWRIISIQLHPAQPVQTAPVGVQYQIEFENSRVSLRVDDAQRRHVNDRPGAGVHARRMRHGDI